MASQVNRRAVVGGAIAASGVLAVPVIMSASAPVTPAATALSSTVAPQPVSGTLIGAYLKIDTANNVILEIGSTEMGQGIMTGLAQLIAEELMLSWSQVQVEHALASAAHPNPYGNPIFGAQLTGGSTSMRGWYLPLRQAAANARQALLQAAAAQIGGSCTLASGGRVTNGSRTVPFSALVTAAAALPMPSGAPLATTGNFIGQKMARTDIPAKIDGSAIFGIDVRVPGMVFASVMHSPVLGGTVKTMPASASGALALVNLGNAVGVVATNTWSAMTIANSLKNKVVWNPPSSTATRDSAAILATGNALLTDANIVPRVYEPATGDPDGSALAAVNAALLAAKGKVDVTYQLPYLAHACMEVMNCTVQLTATSCEVWAPTQGQQFCIPTVQSITGLAPSQIKIHTTFLGGGLGRKIEQDYIAQAVTIAKAIAKPVKLTWSRTQDFQNDKYRPCASIRVQAAVDGAGNVSSLLYRNVSPSINIQRNTVPGNNPEDTGAVAGAVGLPYAIANRRIEFVPNPADIPLGYWRSVGESYNTFAVESAIDELALVAGMDPMNFRRNLLVAGGDMRAVAVLDAVSALSHWTAAPSQGTAAGVAFLKGFGSYIALVAHVSQTTASTSSGTRSIPQVRNVFCAIDCGLAINPDQIEAQMQGGILHGLSAALWGQVLFSAGVPNVSNFNNYRVAKMNDTPAIQVSIVNGTGANAAAPGGVGETGVPCLAPAVANAYARLTGTRLRTLPFFPGATMGDI